MLLHSTRLLASASFVSLRGRETGALSKFPTAVSEAKSDLRGFHGELIRNFSQVDFLRENPEHFKRLFTEGHCDWDISCIAASPDQHASDTPTIVPCVKGIPPSLQIDLKPSAKVHRIGGRRHSDVSQVTRRVPSWNIQTAAERDRQMSEVAANPNALPKSFKRGAIGTSLLVIELKMPVDKIANGLDPFPSWSRIAKGQPGKIHQLAVNFAISAWQKKSQEGDGQLSDMELLRVWCADVEFTAVVEDGVAKNAEPTSRSAYATAVVTESVIIFLAGQIGIGREPLGLKKVRLT